MHDFLRLILEGLDFGKKKGPRVRASGSTRVSRSSWRHIIPKKKSKKILSKKSSLLSGRTLINQTNKTRSVWDPRGYRNQKYYDNVYKTL